MTEQTDAENLAAKYAAVIEKVRAWAEEPEHDEWDAVERILPAIREALASAPADALREHDAKVRAEAIREYVTAARENPHTQYWPASGVLDDAEQWAEEIEKGTI